MRFPAKYEFVRWLVTVGLFLTCAGCSTIYVQNGPAKDEFTDHGDWHHDGLLGLVEFSSPVDLSARCSGRDWERVLVEQNALQAILKMFSYSLYDPWDVKVRCAAQAPPEKANPDGLVSK